MDADGSNVRRLTNAPGYDGGPFFSSDGRKIVWRRFAPDGRSAEIYTMNADGSDQAPDHQSGIDVLGSLFPSLRRLYHLMPLTALVMPILSCSLSMRRGAAMRFA